MPISPLGVNSLLNDLLTIVFVNNSDFDVVSPTLGEWIVPTRSR